MFTANDIPRLVEELVGALDVDEDDIIVVGGAAMVLSQQLAQKII